MGAPQRFVSFRVSFVQQPIALLPRLRSGGRGEKRGSYRAWFGVSGLAGVLFNGRSPTASTVSRMLDAAPHRGATKRVITLGNAALGCAHDGDITDASVDSDGVVAAVICGVLDNRDDLRSELQQLGAPVVGTDDAAVLVAAFRHFGARLPSKLRGVFAAAVTDGETLWCFRDQIGFRSLFHQKTDAGLFFASEAKQVAAGTGVSIEADLEVVENVFWGDFTTATAIRGIERLMPATLLKGSAQSLSRTRYWNPEPFLETATLSAGEMKERFDTLMAQAVRRCLTGRDVISLSGGIDSPTVTAFAAPLYQELFGRPLPALSIVAPAHPTVDETEYIQTVVDRFALPWQTYEQKVFHGGDLDRWVALCDGPVPTVTMNEIEEAYSTARGLGFRTMLTGEMAEFLVDRFDGVLVHLLAKGRVRALAERIRRERARGRRLKRIAGELASVALPRWWMVRRQMKRPCPAWLDQRRAATGWIRHTSAPRHRWRDYQLSPFEGSNPTLEAGEICEMLCGIRLRRPWMDVDLCEFFLSLPAEVKYAGPLRKSIVRGFMRGRVPDAILDRRKKTIFNESVQARINYDELKKWLDRPSVTLPGIDYPLLRSRIDKGDLDLFEYRWARDLASAHAFLERFPNR